MIRSGVLKLDSRGFGSPKVEGTRTRGGRGEEQEVGQIRAYILLHNIRNLNKHIQKNELKLPGESNRDFL